MFDILLFKSDDNTYIKNFADNGIKCKSISPLSFKFVSTTTLKNYLEKPEDFSGLIFTSQRGVESLYNVYKDLKVSTHNMWKEKHIFSIGYNTAEQIRKNLGLQVMGNECSNSQELGSEIIKYVKPFSKPLLYPSGNLQMDELPTILANNDIDFRATTTYITEQDPKLESGIRAIFSESKPKFIVFFSPSGVSFVIPILIKINFDMSSSKFIAIGPSTNVALVKENIPVFGICAEPNVQSIIKLIT